MANNPGRDALAYLDKILEREPDPDPDLFSLVTQNLSRYRDSLIETKGPRVRLDHVNAVLSVIMAGHFPLGNVPWDEIHKARTWLASAID